MDFVRMPAEILEKILRLCPSEMVPDLTLVCVRFNEVIGDSVKLMENFDVNWRKDKALDMRPLIESTRKYGSVGVFELIGIRPNLAQFIQNHSKTLTTISFNDCAMTSSELQSILYQVKGNLAEFNIYDVNFEVDSEIVPIEMPKLTKLDWMYIRGDGIASIVKIFHGAKIKRFSYEDDWEMSDEEITNFACFLLSQPAITDMNITSNVSLKLFDNRDFANSAPFQLQSFFVWINGNAPDSLTASPQVYTSIMHFLQKQQSSLRTLTLARCLIPPAMVRAVLELELNDLRLVDAKFSSIPDLTNVANTSIEKIFISIQQNISHSTEMGLCSVFRYCRNLRKIRYSCVDITFNMSVTMSYEMPKLDTLEFFRCQLEPFYYSTLKKLKIRSCDIEETTRLVRVNRQLEILHVPSQFRYDGGFIDGINETNVKSIRYV